jgi:hypothetical protein
MPVRRRYHNLRIYSEYINEPNWAGFPEPDHQGSGSADGYH